MRSSTKIAGHIALTAGMLAWIASTPRPAYVEGSAAPELAPERERPTLTLVPPPPAVEKKEPRLTWKRVLNILGIALAIGTIVFWALFLRPQSLGGSAGYVLVSGKSMWPHYHTGDLVLVEKKSNYHVGEVVAYHVPKGDPMAGAQVIHRIIGGDAQHGFVIQGDNRTAPDVWRPKPADIVGAKELRIPDAVVVLQYLRSPIFLGLLAACLVFTHVLIRPRKEGEPA